MGARPPKVPENINKNARWRARIRRSLAPVEGRAHSAGPNSSSTFFTFFRFTLSAERRLSSGGVLVDFVGQKSPQTSPQNKNVHAFTECKAPVLGGGPVHRAHCAGEDLGRRLLSGQCRAMLLCGLLGFATQRTMLLSGRLAERRAPARQQRRPRSEHGPPHFGSKVLHLFLALLIQLCL